MKVFVTGANGFIGSHISTYFFENGHSVIGLDRKFVQAEWTSVALDMADEKAIVNALIDEMPDIIIHCAGSADVGKSVADPLSDYVGNVSLTHNLLFAVHKVGLQNTRIVFLSSAAVYGNPGTLPITEETGLDPLSPYALHKVMCEDICQYMHSNYGMDVKILRIFSAYGEGLKKQIFWDMYQKSKSTGKLSMYGTGKESRDYIHIKDLIYAIYLVSIQARREDCIFNIANGEEITILEATEIFANAIQLEKEKIFFTGEVKEGNPINWRADISKLKLLGYTKNVSIQDGIMRYIEWLKKTHW